MKLTEEQIAEIMRDDRFDPAETGRIANYKREKKALLEAELREEEAYLDELDLDNADQFGLWGMESQ